MVYSRNRFEPTSCVGAFVAGAALVLHGADALEVRGEDLSPVEQALEASQAECTCKK